jgi:hypothetical protein
MPQQPLEPGDAERQYHETTAPANPPNSVLRPAVRRTAVWTYLGLLVVFFLIAGAAFLFWTVAGPRVDDERTDPSAVGTSGELLRRERTPGGFDPAPRSSSTEAEIEYRGGALSQPGAPQGAAAITSLQALREQSPQELAGRRIDLDNVEVERADGAGFSIRQGDDRAAVVTAGGGPTVQAGQRVDVSGTLEASGTGSRIRATRIDVK